MATIVQIDGVGKVELDDSFKNLSVAQQQATVDEIANHHAAPAPAPAPAEKPGFWSTLGSSLAEPIVHTIEHPLDTAEAIYNYPTNTLRGLVKAGINVVSHPIDTAQAVGGLVRGAAQNVRELSAPEFRGSAAPWATPEEMAPTKDIIQNPEMVIARHPYATAATVASPTLRAIGVASDVAGITPFVNKISSYGKSAPIISDVKTTAQKLANVLSSKSAKSAAEAQNAAEAERRSAVLARTLQSQAEKEAATAAEKATGAASFGKPSHLTEIGEGPQSAVMASKNAIIDNQYKQDAILRPAFENLVAEKEAAGKSLANLPEAKNLLKEAKNALNPDVTTSNVATSLPSAPEAKLHQMVVDALENRRVYLTAKEAKIASANGFPVKIEKATGAPYREFKTSAESLENLNRRMGDAAFGKEAGGFDGVPIALAKDYYSKIQPIIDKFSEGASKATRDNWRSALENLKPYQNTPVGKAISGDLAETAVKQLNPATGKWEEVSPAIPRTTAANVPSAITRGGLGSFEQFNALAKQPQVALKFAKDELANAFYDPKTGGALDYDQAIAKVAPGTKLGDIVNGLPKVLGSEGQKLQTAVRQHLQQLQDAKIAGVKAQEWGAKAKTLSEAVETKLGKAAEFKASAAAAEKSRREIKQLYNDLSSPEITPEAAISKSRNAFDRAHKSGLINDEQHAKLMNTIDEATKKYGQTKKRDAIIRRALGALGLGTVAGTGYEIGKSL